MKWIFVIVVAALLFITVISVSAAPTNFTEFVAYGDAFRANNDTHILMMWNATGAHTFLTSGNTTMLEEYLVVAGGGGYGRPNPSVGMGGGGGAGGFLTGTDYSLVPGSTVNITVGAAGVSANGSAVTATSGSNSSFGYLTPATGISAKGGGRGGQYGVDNTEGGGSGGGSGGRKTAVGSGIAGQGYSGGASSSGLIQGGGGGGAGSAGFSAADSGYGGNGLYSSITGVSTQYAHGGGNAHYYTIPSMYGAGGGINGGSSQYAAVHPPTSGIVIFSFLSSVDLNASFVSDPNPSEVGESVTFNDTSIGIPDVPSTWNWSFGDGNTSTEQNPIYSYTGFGTFTVMLNVTSISGNTSNTSSLQYVTNISGFTPQDIWMEGQYLQTWHITDSATGLPIPVVDLHDTAMQTYTTTNGTGYLTEPFGASVVTFISEGYDYKAISYFFDAAETHDVQLTPESGEDVSDWAATHNVKFTVRSLFGGPVADVNVTAVYVETTGPLAWLDSWAGVPDAVDIQNTTLSGQTGTDGAIVFLMVESVQYEITAYKAGEVDKSMKIYPKDDYYTIWADVVNKSAMFERGYNELEQIQIRVNGTEVNTTHGRISVQYIDLLSQTTSATIYVNQSRTVGNVTTETTVASYTSVAAGNFSRDFVLSGTRDQSYTVRCNGTGTVFPVVRRDFGVTFKPGPISFGIPEELLVYVGMVGLIFIALVFVRTLPGPATIVIMFFAWIFYFMGWWKDLGSEVIVVLALIIYSTLAIVFNVMIRSKKRFFE